MSASAAVSSVHHVRRRTSGGRRTVWQALLTMKSSRGRVASSSRQNASTLGVWRRSRPKISSRCAPLGEVGLRGVAAGGVARKARRDDEMRAGAQQLEPGLIADLHAPAGEQRDAAAQIGELGRACGSSARRTAGTAGRRSDGRPSTSPCRRSSAAARWPRARFVGVTSFGSKPSGGKTFGVVNTGWRRSARMPVSFSTLSSRFSRRNLLLARASTWPAGGACGRRGCAPSTRREESACAPPRAAPQQTGDFRDRVEHVGRGLELLARRRARVGRRAGGGHGLQRTASGRHRLPFLRGLLARPAAGAPFSSVPSPAAPRAASGRRRRDAATPGERERLAHQLLVGRRQLNTGVAGAAPGARFGREHARRLGDEVRLILRREGHRRGAEAVLQRGEDSGRRRGSRDCPCVRLR